MEMDQIPVNLTLPDLLASFLRRSGDIPWLDWLPLAQVAVESPEGVVVALNRLRLEQQFDLISLLRRPEAGPLADAILVVLARYASEIQDDQVRQFILEDAVQARAHQESTLQIIQGQVVAQVAVAQERLRPNFDLAQEIVRLEKELADIRRQEHDQDERFARVHELEREILRLETRRRILTHYDEVERRRYREALQSEVETLQRRKDDLERSIGEIIGRRDNLRAQVRSKESELQVIQEELQAAQNRLMELQQNLQGLKERLKKATDEQRALQTQGQEIQAQLRQVEEDNRQRKRSLEAERKKLAELQEAARRSEMAELERRVQEVYRLLPSDLVDQALSPG